MRKVQYNVIAMLLVVSLLCGCGVTNSQQEVEHVPSGVSTEHSAETSSIGEVQSNEETSVTPETQQNTEALSQILAVPVDFYSGIGLC